MIEVIFFEELRLRSIRDQEVRRLLVRHQTMGQIVWCLGMLMVVMVIRVLGVKGKKRKQMEKNEVDLEHNSPHASGVFWKKNHW